MTGGDAHAAPMDDGAPGTPATDAPDDDRGAADAGTRGPAGTVGPSPLLPFYVAGLVAAAAALAVAAGGSMPLGSMRSSDWLALPVFVGLLVAGEYLIVRFRLKGEVDGLNLIEAVLAPVIVIFPLPVTVAAVALSQLVAAVARRNALVKSAFNVGQWSLAAGLGAVAFRALAPGGDPVAILGAVIVVLGIVGAVNHVAFSVVLALAGRQPLAVLLRTLTPGMIPGWLVGWALNSLVGLLFVLAYLAHPVAVLLFPIPMAMLHLAYRGYAGARSDRVRLTGLHRAASVLSDPIDPFIAIGPFLAEVARSFEAKGACLVLEHDTAISVHEADARSRDVTRSTFEPFEGHPVSFPGALLAVETTSRISAIGSQPLAATVAARGWRDALAAPVRCEGGLRGTLVVYDQAGLEGFEAGELAVLEAVAREAASTFDKGRLLASVVEERRRFAQILGSTHDGILTVDADGIVRSWNTAQEHITGVAATTAVGRPVVESLPHLRSGGRAVDLGAWATDLDLPSELELVRTDGGVRMLDCSYSRADADGDDRRPVLVVVARDVTQSRQVESLREEVGRLAETAALQRDVVAQLHQALIPDPPSVEGVELAVQYLPSDESAPTGGDLYDWQLLPSGEVHIAVVDVLGHGVAATKHAVAVTTTLRTLALDGCPLEDLLERTDELLSRADEDLVATAVVVRYNPSTGDAHIGCGGHPPALVVTVDGQVQPVDATGGAIGWPGAGSDTTARVRLGTGDSLLLYTDGLVEARKNIIEGLDQLRHNASRLAPLPAAEIAQQLVTRSLAGAERRDDALALVVRCTAGRPDTTTRSWRIAPSRSAVAEVRRSLTEWLAGVAVPSATSDDIVIAVSELLNNAVVVARASVQLRVSVAGEEIALEVRDDGPGFVATPHAERPGDLGHALAPVESEHGRGLFIVRTLLDAFHLTSDAHGTVAAGARSISADGRSRAVSAAITPARGTPRPLSD